MVDLSDIITSKTRIKVLNLFFSNIKEIYHVRGAVRGVHEEINAVRRELDRLEKANILKKEVRGNRLYYFVNTEHPLFEDILSIIAKTSGLGKELIDNKSKIGKVNLIMFSGKFARRKDRKKDDDVDILFVGDIVLPELAAIIRKEEGQREKEINYTVMSREEFDFRKKRRDPFLAGIVSGSRVMIIGDEEALVN